MKFAIGITIILLLLTACSTEDTTVIGGAFALTGMASTWGEAEMNGAQLAIEESGKDITFVVEDIGDTNIKALSAVNKLITLDKPDIIIGATWLDTFGGAAPLADQYDTIMITPSASITALKNEHEYPNIFSTYYRSESEAEAVAQEITGNVVLVLDNDPFFQDLSTVFKQVAEGYEIIILDEFDITPGETDFRTILLKIKQLQPEAIYWGLSEEKSILAFLKQKKELDINTEIYTTTAMVELAEKEKGLFEGMYIATHANVNTEFSKKYKERFGKDPVFSASNAYDATKIALEALQNTDGQTNTMQEYLLINEFDTITFGKVKFDELGGLTGGGFVVKVIHDGKLE